MRIALTKPIVIPPVPATAPLTEARPVSIKRVARLRVNWFALGAIFGVGLSIFLNFLFVAIVEPRYHAIMARTHAPAHKSASAATPQKPKAQAALAVPQPTEKAPSAPVYPRTLALKLSKGDTLRDMLVAQHVQPSEAEQVIAALKAKFNPQKLGAGQKISLTLARHETLGDKAAVKELAIKMPELSIALARLQDGGFSVAANENTSTQKTFRGYGKVRSSLFQAGAEAGIPATAMRELVKAFSYDIDFQREIHPGDSVEVLIDRKPAKNAGYRTEGGTLRYAALTLRGKKHEIFRFKNAYGEMAWFDGKGNSIKKSLLRTPLDAARITSGFGMRTHPIMGYTKMHRGVDFGASSGTPIMAAGDGVVTFKGWKGGYGNVVILKHNATYETVYGHCARFAKINLGDKVRQGQVIAYVGMTGMATGPHLHYEVRQNNTQVNPVAKQFNMAGALSGKQMAAFKAAKQSALNELAALAKPAAATVASAR